MKYTTENNEQPVQPFTLQTNLLYIKEDKTRFSLLLWEMSEAFLLANDGLSKETLEQFQADCQTLRGIIKSS